MSDEFSYDGSQLRNSSSTKSVTHNTITSGPVFVHI